MDRPPKKTSEPLLLRGSHVDYFQHLFADQQDNLKVIWCQQHLRQSKHHGKSEAGPPMPPPPRNKAPYLGDYYNHHHPLRKPY